MGCLLAARSDAACAGNVATSPAPAAPDTSPVASGESTCNTDALPSWPRAGQVTTSGIIPVLASSQKVVGKSRLVFSLINQANKPVASPDIHLEMAFFDLCASPTTPTETLTPIFAWGIVDQRGFYIAIPTLTRAGTWGVAMVATDASGKQTGARLQFSVAASGTTPAIGAAAPSVRTPTLADVGVLTDGAAAPIAGVVPLAATENWSLAPVCFPDASVATIATPHVPARVRVGIAM